MGLLKYTLPVVGGLVALLSVALIYDTRSFFEAFDMASVGDEATSPLATTLIWNLSCAWAALGLLAVASYHRGSETRFRIGIALAAVLLASVYSDFEMPFEFELDKKGRKTDVPIPNDLSSTSPRFVVKMLLTVPLVLALIAHEFEPGFLTEDKKGGKTQ